VCVVSFVDQMCVCVVSCVDQMGVCVVCGQDGCVCVLLGKGGGRSGHYY